MLVIGLTGGIASGKSLVADQFRALGARVLDADKMGHQVLQDPAVIAAAAEYWGDSILAAGQIDRSELAKIVFEDSASGRNQLARLEQLTHPRIRQLLLESLSRLRSNPIVQAVVLDAPVMFKAGWHEMCDKIVFVDAPLELRRQRAATRGWDADELMDREKRQLALEKKRSFATDIIDNSSTPDACRKQVHDLWSRWHLNQPDNS